MGKLVDKLMNLLGVPEPEEEEPVAAEQHLNSPSREPGKRGAVVSLHPAKPLRVVLAEPTEFEEAQGIAEHLKSRRQVILNLEATDKETAQRILDFISGACYALDGRVQKVSPGVILFVPPHVDISNELKSDMSEKTFLPWLIGREKRI